MFGPLYVPPNLGNVEIASTDTGSKPVGADPVRNELFAGGGVLKPFAGEALQVTPELLEEFPWIIELISYAERGDWESLAKRHIEIDTELRSQRETNRYISTNDSELEYRRAQGVIDAIRPTSDLRIYFTLKQFLAVSGKPFSGVDYDTHVGLSRAMDAYIEYSYEVDGTSYIQRDPFDPSKPELDSEFYGISLRQVQDIFILYRKYMYRMRNAGPLSASQYDLLEKQLQDNINDVFGIDTPELHS